MKQKVDRLNIIIRESAMPELFEYIRKEKFDHYDLSYTDILNELLLEKKKQDEIIDELSGQIIEQGEWDEINDKTDTSISLLHRILDSLENKGYDTKREPVLGDYAEKSKTDEILEVPSFNFDNDKDEIPPFIPRKDFKVD